MTVATESGSRFKTMLRRAANALLLAIGTLTATDALSSPVGQTVPAKIDVLASGAVQAAFPELKAAAESALGIQIYPVFGTASGTLSDRIRSGAAFDVAILTPAVNAQFVQSRALQKGTFAIAKVEIGLGLLGEKPAKVDIVSRKGLKALLTGARMVRYAPHGMAEPTFQKMVAELQLDGKITIAQPPPPPPPGASVGAMPAAFDELPKGTYIVAIMPMSEFRPQNGPTKLGSVPPDLQVPVQLEAAISARSAHETAALRFVDFLQSLAGQAILRKYGFSGS